MIDSRLRQARALLDDARTLLVDIIESGPATGALMKDFNQIEAARTFINSALVYVQAADSGEPRTVAEQLDAAESGDQFAQVLQGFFGALERGR